MRSVSLLLACLTAVGCGKATYTTDPLQLASLSEPRTFEGLGVPVRWLALTPNRRWVVAAGQTNYDPGPGLSSREELKVAVWDIESGKRIFHHGFNSQQTGWPIGLRDHYLLTRCSGEDQAFRVLQIDLLTGKRVGQQDFAFPQAQFGHLFCAPDGRRLVGAHHEHACVWDATTGKVVRRFSGLPLGGGTNTGGFSADGRFAAVASPNGTALLPLEGKQPALMTEERKHCVMGVCVSPDGQRVAGGDTDGPVRLFEPRAGKLELTRVFQGPTAWTTGVSFSADGKWVLCASDGDMWLLDVETGRERHRFSKTGLSRGSDTAQFVDGNRILIGTHDGRVLLRPLLADVDGATPK